MKACLLDWFGRKLAAVGKKLHFDQFDKLVC